MYYDRHVFLCENKREGGDRECCADKDSKRLRKVLKEKTKAAKLDQRIRINGAGCLDRCEEGPTVVVYPEGRWFRLKNEADMDRFVETYLKDGSVAGIEDLELPDEHPADRLKQEQQMQQ